MEAFQTIHIKADTPYACGVQYGQQAKEKIRAGVEVYRRYFAKTSDKSWDKIQQYAMAYLPDIKQMMPEVLEETWKQNDGLLVPMERESR